MPLTNEQLQELKVSAECVLDILGRPDRMTWYVPGDLMETFGIVSEDDSFIAACSPDVILGLIAEVERLRAALAQIAELPVGYDAPTIARAALKAMCKEPSSQQ